jgi:hypothetical protein
MSQEITNIVSCGLCGQKLRIPAKRDLDMKCPTCGEIIAHNQVEINYRVIPFRCSQTGQRFKVVFSRDAEEERYRIKAISQEDKLTVTPYSRAHYTVGTEQNFNINEFDTSGWYCGVCEWGKDHSVSPRYVQCGKCGELVCGRRSFIADGKKHFRCYEGCGSEGVLEEGGPTMSSLQGEAFQRKPQAVESGFGDHRLNPGDIRPRQATVPKITSGFGDRRLRQSPPPRLLPPPKKR